MNRNLLQRLYNGVENWIEDIDLVERVKCINPRHGYKNYLEANRDDLTNYPNYRCMKKDVSRWKGQSIGVLETDVAGLKTANEAYGKRVGNMLIFLQLAIIDKAISDFSENGKVYRIHGDDNRAMVRYANDDVMRKIASKINDYCNLINLRRGSQTFQEESHEYDPSMINCVDDMLKKFESLPNDLPIHLNTAYECSIDGKDILIENGIMKELEKEVSERKREFYSKHPEWDPRKSNVIERLKKKQLV